MPAPGSADLANELREAIATYLWKQWRAVGAMSSEPPARIIVDPEALILMSLWMVTREQRLSDLLWSWIEVNSSLVSIASGISLSGSPTGSNDCSELWPTAGYRRRRTDAGNPYAPSLMALSTIAPRKRGPLLLNSCPQRRSPCSFVLGSVWA